VVTAGVQTLRPGQQVRLPGVPANSQTSSQASAENDLLAMDQASAPSREQTSEPADDQARQPVDDANGDATGDATDASTEARR
jgi:hypothetical protein